MTAPKYIPLIYSILAYLLTWSVVLGLYFSYRWGHLTEEALNIYYSFGALGPALAALITCAFFYGKPGIRKWLGKLRRGTIHKESWWLAAMPLFFFAAGYLMYPLFKGEWFSFTQFFRESQLSHPRALMAWGLPFIAYALFEEPGWRGFLLPHLQENNTAWRATVFLAVIWAGWHAPFFLFRFEFSVLISIGFFFGLFVGAIILTSIYNFSRGYLWPVIFFHLANNLASAFDQEFIVAVISTGFIFLAIYIYRVYGPEHLARPARTQNFFLSHE